NHANNNGRATASMVEVSPGSYAIVVSSNFEGTAKGSIYVPPGPPPTTPAVDVAPAISALPMFASETSSAATDAQFTISGIAGTITRSSNTVSDVIDGLTLNLQGIGASTITIKEDVAGSTAKVQDIVDAFNDIVAFVNENNLITREEDGENVNNVFSPLSSSRVDDNAVTAIKSAISGSTYTSGGLVRIFADLGVTTERDGTLKFDTDKFAEALGSEATSVNEILMNFGDLAGTVQGLAIYQFTRANGLIDVTVNGNKSLITNLNERIAQAESQILKQEEIMRARFSRLEGLIGNLQNQQSALTSALSGLGQ
ncbi:MAG: flagellar filament capping protein FliD, partial [Deltaproteobacteria bacterium]|nr:flagellar filament capping protein FliD [Deltaproteobacteria bacterium]